MRYNSYHTSIKQLARQYKPQEKFIRNMIVQISGDEK